MHAYRKCLHNDMNDQAQQKILQGSEKPRFLKRRTQRVLGVYWACGIFGQALLNAVRQILNRKILKNNDVTISITAT